MTATQTVPTAFGTLTDPSTLRLQRTLPGPIERVWAWLTDSELRRQWLAAGAMDLVPGAPFELTWRNDELSQDAAERPDGFPAESRATCTVTEVESLRRLRFRWPEVGDVTFELEPSGDEVTLTVTHRQLPDRKMTVLVGAGWHAHCDILVARLEGAAPPSFWREWVRLREAYDRRVVA